MDLEWKLL